MIDLTAAAIKLNQLREEQRELAERGLWRDGRRTLLNALSLQHHEVALCAALAWVLEPTGWQGTGPRTLRAFLRLLKVPEDQLGGDLVGASIETEEEREGTRADLVIRLLSGRTILVEAKVFADEQPHQADRLARLWEAEDLHLVFLTRYGFVPRTAVQSAGRWRPVTWLEVADALRTAAVENGVATPRAGVMEFIETIDEFGGPSRAK